MTSKPGSLLCSGLREEHGGYPTYWPCGVRCIGGVTLISGSLTELGNLSGDAKGKGASGETARPKVPMRRRGADCLVVVMKRGNACRAKGAGYRRWDRVKVESVKVV